MHVHLNIKFGVWIFLWLKSISPSTSTNTLFYNLFAQSLEICYMFRRHYLACVCVLFTLFPLTLIWIYLAVKWWNLHILLKHIAALVLNNFFLVFIQWCIILACSSVLILLASCQQTCMTYIIAVVTVKNSWSWTEELSETCRVLFQN